MKKKHNNPSQILKEVRDPKYRQRVEKNKKKEEKKNPAWEDPKT